jgi:hypothetical protein
MNQALLFSVTAMLVFYALEDRIAWSSAEQFRRPPDPKAKKCERIHPARMAQRKMA